MKVFLYFICFITISSYFLGCSAYQPPRKYVVEKTRAYSKNYDEVWQKTIEWFAKNGTPIKNMDKASGFISTEYNLSANRTQNCLDCGTGGQNLLAYQRLDNPKGNFNVLIKKLDEGKTQVDINCFFSATSNVYVDGKLSRSESIDCNSTGQLEKEYLDYIGIGEKNATVSSTNATQASPSNPK